MIRSYLCTLYGDMANMTLECVFFLLPIIHIFNSFQTGAQTFSRAQGVEANDKHVAPNI